eukprot:jgi/Bigna1/139515/aug1.51_g14223
MWSDILSLVWTRLHNLGEQQGVGGGDDDDDDAGGGGGGGDGDVKGNNEEKGQQVLRRAREGAEDTDSYHLEEEDDNGEDDDQNSFQFHHQNRRKHILLDAYVSVLRYLSQRYDPEVFLDMIPAEGDARFFLPFIQDSCARVYAEHTVREMRRMANTL